MGRVPTLRSRPASVAPGGQRHKEQTTNTKKEWKVVLEEVTQKKKQLITLECSTTTPPRRYIFVAAGNPKLTFACKELARKEGKQIYVVSTTKHRDTELSTQVHRVGYHFPQEIVTRACMSLGISLSDQGTILNQHLFWPKEDKSKGKASIKNGPKKGNGNIKQQHSQDQVDYEARQAIKDLFPAIPAADLRSVIKHAFDLNTDRVGAMVDDLPLPRRVQLAVVAHIRHLYTDYDKLLKAMPYQAARATIERQTLGKLSEWRGDNQEDSNAMEDILREVIVISEDEDGDEEGNEQIPITEHYHTSSRTTQANINSAVARRSTPGVTIDDYNAVPYRGRSIDSDEIREATSLGGGQYVLQRTRNDRAAARRHHAWTEFRNQNRVPALVPTAPSTRLDEGKPQSARRAEREPPIILLETAPASCDSFDPHIKPVVQGPSGYRKDSADTNRHLIEPGGHAPELISHRNNVYSTTLEPKEPGTTAAAVFNPNSFRAEHFHDGRGLRSLDTSLNLEKQAVIYDSYRGYRQRRTSADTQSPEETVLPSIEPATPTLPRDLHDGTSRASAIVVTDSLPRYNKRRRIEGEYFENLHQPEVVYMQSHRHGNEPHDMKFRNLDVKERGRDLELPMHGPDNHLSGNRPGDITTQYTSGDTFHTYSSGQGMAEPISNARAANSYTLAQPFEPNNVTHLESMLPPNRVPIIQYNENSRPIRYNDSNSHETGSDRIGYNVQQAVTAQYSGNLQQSSLGGEPTTRPLHQPSSESGVARRNHAYEYGYPQQVVLVDNSARRDVSSNKKGLHSVYEPIQGGNVHSTDIIPQYSRNFVAQDTDHSLQRDHMIPQQRQYIGSRLDGIQRNDKQRSKFEWNSQVVPYEPMQSSGFTEALSRQGEAKIRPHAEVIEAGDVFRDQFGLLRDRRTGREVVELR